ncbi:MAG TPA: carboxypeptidase regulatory-like domain-containing protein [Candidatus Solibacter sp.]|nr:carboxypeptidase regulatory-like domain-containing protein [Candidatus Solibacter sp.]
MLRAIFLGMIALMLAAQEKCVVEGMVANAATGEPLRRVSVTIRRSDGKDTPHVTLTDAQGKYVFEDVEPATYLLLAERSGFAPQRHNTTLKLQRGQKASGILVMMTPHAVITGRVTDEEGEPVVGADVQVSSLNYSSGIRQFTRSSGASTNDLGEFRVFGLAPGRYFVSATFRGSPGPNVAEEYATTYHPRTVDSSSAIPLQVAAGATLRNIDITLMRVRTVAVRGKIACDIEGQKRFSVSLIPRMTAGISSSSLMGRGAIVRPDGSFEVARVTPGSYMLSATAQIDEKRYTARVGLQVGSTNVEGVQIAIHPGGGVRGAVLVEGRPEEKLAGLNVGLQAWQSGGILFGNPPRGKTDAEGKFTLEDVSIDHYSFYANGLPEGYYVKSVRTGGIDVLADGFESGSGEARFEVVVSPRAASVEGTADAGAAVVLVPDQVDRHELYKRVMADQTGRFSITSLPPGKYRLFAWEDVPPFAWMDPDFLKSVEGKAERVTLGEGSPVTVQLKVIQ